MKYICLDLRENTEIAEVHEVLKTMLDFPEYYGDNYNAMYDELTSVQEDTEIKIIVEEKKIEKWEILRRVISDAATANKHILLKGKVTN